MIRVPSLRRRVGGSIRYWREYHGWTQEKLGRLAGVKGCHVAHYEASRRMPALENLIALAEALGVTLDQLTGRQA